MRDIKVFTYILSYVVATPPGLGIRHLQCLLLYLSMCVTQGIKGSVSVIIVAMTSKTSINGQTFEWDKTTQDLVNSSFFWGYMAMQLPAGYMAAKFGGKRLIASAIILNGLFSLTTPILGIWGGWLGVCCVRVVIGFTQGMMVPSVHTILGKWVPLAERGRLGAFVYAGGFMGVVSYMMISGLLCGSYGWPSAFYFQGLAALVIGILWTWIGAEAPSDYSSISLQERNYIEVDLDQTVKKKMNKVPWRYMLTSAPVWAICAGHAGCTWGHNTLLSEIPAYMSKVMRTNIQKSGLFTALPFLAMWLMTFVYSFIFDALVNKGIFSPTVTRKIANSMGSWPVAIGLIGLAYIPIDDIVLVETLLIVTVGIKSGSYLGYNINHMDLSPNYSGSIMSLTNFVANGLTILAPITAGLILTDDTDVILWRKVFFITAAVYIISNLIFVIFGSAVKQPWNDPNYDPKTTDKSDIKKKDACQIQI